jgi:hypothetical protein
LKNFDNGSKLIRRGHIIQNDFIIPAFIQEIGSPRSPFSHSQLSKNLGGE